MKKSMFKSAMKYAALLIAAAIVMVSCTKDETEPDTPPIVILDGYYVTGAGTAVSELSTLGAMKSTKNEVGQVDRASLLEIYIAIEGGTQFNIIKVEGGVQTSMGPGADFAVVDTANDGRNSDEPKKPYDFSRGSLAAGTSFTAASDGLYHIVYDTELEVAAVAKAEWGVIGAAIGSWSNSSQLATNFNKTKMDFVAEDTVFAEAEFKFRYNNGWKILLDGELVRVNTNLGGALGALTAGGDNIKSGEYGIYDITLTWELGKGFVASLVYNREAPALAAYPEAMYIAGDATAYGWPTVGPGENLEAEFHKCAGPNTEGIFWKICYLETGKGFKISAADWGDPNLGFAGITEFDASGVTITDNGGNMAVATSGMYMIVLNLRDDETKLSVIAPEVYGIGDAFGGYTEDVPANLFTVDNTAKTLTSPALTADGNIRMYVNHSWIPDWWNAEFNVYSGKIEYRNDGGDQAAVPGTASQVITLTFDNNTGTIQ